MTALAKVLRLADGDAGAGTTAVPSADPDNDGDNDTTEPDEGHEVLAVSLVPGMLVSHRDHTKGRKVRVDRVSNRGTHVDVIAHHPANGRGLMMKPNPKTKFKVHEASTETT